MANLGGSFDATSIPEDDRSFDPLPAGDYLVQVIDSEVIAKDNGDTRLKLTLEVLEGDYTGRRIWDNLNLVHSNPAAQSIAQRTFADLILAAGLTAVEDTEELHFKPVIAKVKIRPAQNGYEAQNQVGKYRGTGVITPAGKAAPQAASRPAPGNANAPTSRPAAAAGASRPWAR